MSNFSDLPTAERKRIIAEKQEFLRKHMPPEEYAKLEQEIEANQIKIDPSIAGKTYEELMEEHPELQTREYKRQKRKEEREWRRDMRDKPDFLVFLAGLLQKVFHIALTLYSMAGILMVPLFGWQVYKAFSSAGWQAIFHTKYTLYLVAYFVIMFLIKTVYYALYKYANDY